MQKLLLHRKGVWRTETGSRVALGHAHRSGEHWQFVLTQQHERFRVTVSQRGVRAYSQLLPKTACNVLLLPTGVAELTRVNGSHRELATQVNAALSPALAGQALCVVTVLLPSQRINGRIFRTGGTVIDVFSDAAFESHRQTPTTTLWRCCGGTYLIRLNRHPSGNIHRIEVTAQQPYDLLALKVALQELSKAARP